MNFEEYKKQFEKLTKIDTPEKLAFYESQYHQELLRIEDSKYFEPLKAKLENGILERYTQGLIRIFELDRIAPNQFQFLILSSFEVEKLLVFENSESDYSIMLTTLEEQYWTILYENKPVATEKVSLTTLVDKAFGERIFSLLTQVITEAKEPKWKGFVLDGTIYELTGFLEGKPVTVTKHSPDEESKSGRVIALMEQISENINQIDYALIKNLEIEIDNLLKL